MTLETQYKEYMSRLQQCSVRGHTSEKYDQYYYGHGKLLMTGEYFVMDGASGLALPTIVGQSMGVRYEQSFNPKMVWKSYDVKGNLWFEAEFEFWHFDLLKNKSCENALFLQHILRQARKQNKHFLRDDQSVFVETHLGFPLDWGLGSSSTLIYNVAQWAYVSPFELLFNTHGGSGYDVACAQSDGPIIYEKKKTGPKWAPVNFFPNFHENLYFVHLGKKQNSREAIEYYKSKRPFSSDVIREVSAITREMIEVEDYEIFKNLINSHEKLISSQLDIEPLSKQFVGFNGVVKSLGAWGGDFCLVASNMSSRETLAYFTESDLPIVIPFKDLILKTPVIMPNYPQVESVH